MSVLNWDRVWARIKKLPEFRGRQQWQYRPWIRIGQFALTTEATSSPTPVEFASGGIILGVLAGLSVASQAGTQAIRDLTGFRIGIDYTGSDGALISGGRANGAAIFGMTGENQFPCRELIMPTNSVLNVTVQNLTTSTIAVDIAFHTMVFRAAAT